MKIYNKKITGASLIDLIMVVGIMGVILSGTLMLYASATDSVREADINYLGFVYHLSLSHHADGVMIIDNKTASIIQNDVIKTLDCSKDYCLPFNKLLVAGAFIELGYTNNKVEYLKIYSHRIKSIFFKDVKMNPYRSALFEKQFLFREKDVEENPEFSNIINIMDNVTHEYYNENDLNTPVSDDICQSIGFKCLDVLHYRIKK
jgi:hypothetical protein